MTQKSRARPALKYIRNSALGSLVARYYAKIESCETLKFTHGGSLPHDCGRVSLSIVPQRA